MDCIAVAMARHIVDGCDEDTRPVCFIRLMWTSLRWAAEARSCRSDGVMMEAAEPLESSALRRGDWWPESERRISCSILGGFGSSASTVVSSVVLSRVGPEGASGSIHGGLAVDARC